MARKLELLCIFNYLDDLLIALESMKRESINIKTVYAPTPHHEIGEALGTGGLSSVRYFTLAGGILGILTGIGLTVYTSLEWKFIVSGKPPIPVVTTVIVAFEFCILMAILFNMAGMLIQARMPKVDLPEEYDSRFSGDRFGVLVLCSETERDAVERLMTEAGAEEVHEVGR